MIFSSSLAMGQADSLLWAGIDAMYNYHYESADRYLDSAMVLAPTHPVPPFISLANSWLWSLTELGPNASHATLITAIDETIPRYRALLQDDPDDPQLLLYLGSTYGMRARIALSQKRWTTVVTSGLRGLRYVQRAHAIDSTLADVYLPIGIFDYYAGSSGKSVQLVARLFGINADKAVGLAELDRAAATAEFAWIEAASTLAILHTYIEDDPEAAALYVDSLVNHFPGNYYFNFLRGDIALRRGRETELREQLPNLAAMIERSHPGQRREWQAKYANLLAGLAYSDGDWPEARRLCDAVIADYQMEFDWHLGFALYRRGQISEREGDFDAAVADYQRTVKLDNQTYVVRDARTAIERILDSAN